ncbi:MAG: SpoIIE family protein phosphatase [Mycobacterium sp.]
MMAGEDWDRLVGNAADVQRVFYEAPVIIVAFEGPDLRLVAANAAFRALTPRLEELGIRAEDFVPELQGQDFLEHFKRVYATGEPVRAKEWRIQVDIDGSGNVAEHFFDLLITPRHADDGSIEGVICVVEEVTERVAARNAAVAQAQAMSQRYEQVRLSATVMQQALLASSLPVLPGVDIAAEYLVAAEDTAAGGDWFDAIPVGNRVVFVVGDVVGHGIGAAAVMSQLRTALRLQVFQGLGVAECIAAVDRFSALVPGSKSATVCVGALDVETGEFEYCTAGHPPPLLVAADAHVRFLEPSGAGPLGRGATVAKNDREAFPVRTESLNLGDAVLLYTDGLIERPGRPVAASTTEFADLAANIMKGGGFPIGDARPIERLCTQTLELLLRTSGYSDDVTLLALQRISPPSPLRISLGATSQAAGIVRAELRRWLDALSVEAPEVLAVVHALSEYVENAAEHAYKDRSPGAITVDVELSSEGFVEASVVDHGCWRTSSTAPSTRGRGLALADMLSTRCEVVGTERGTTARFSLRLSRPARIVTDPQIAHIAVASAAAVDAFSVLEADGVVCVAGEVDSATSPVLAGQIAAFSRSGTLSLTIDLNAVTHLGSAAISVLADARERAHRHGTELRLLASPGTTAHHVLSLVQVPLVIQADSNLFE